MVGMSLHRKIIVSGVILMFAFLAVSSIVFGSNTRISDKKEKYHFPPVMMALWIPLGQCFNMMFAILEVVPMVKVVIGLW